MASPHTRVRRKPTSGPATSQMSYSSSISSIPVEMLSPPAYLHTLYERRDILRQCALDMDSSGKGKGKGKAREDRGALLRTRVHEALQELDPWSALGHVLKLQSTLGGGRYIGTSLTPTEPMPLPEPYRDRFPETDEEWEELREKMQTVEKVSGWVRSVEVSVEVPVKGKRNRDGATASPARKKRKAEEEMKTSGYDPKDPSPLGFVTVKRVPSQTKSVASPAKRGSPKVLVPSSSRGSSPVAAPPPLPPQDDVIAPPPLPVPQNLEDVAPTRPSISSIPEDTFFPPSFPSHLATSTPPKTRTRARPRSIGNEPSVEEGVDETRGEMKDLRQLLSAARTPSPKKARKQQQPSLAKVSSNPLALHQEATSSKLSSGEEDLPAEEESLNFGINAVASPGSAVPPLPDVDDDLAPLYAATQLRGAYDSQFDLDGGLGDVEGFLERDVDVFGEQEEEVEERKDDLDLGDSVEKSDEEEVQDEDTAFGRWFNLPRRSASMTGSGDSGGGGNWFGRR